MAKLFSTLLDMKISLFDCFASFKMVQIGNFTKDFERKAELSYIDVFYWLEV